MAVSLRFAVSAALALMLSPGSSSSAFCPAPQRRAVNKMPIGPMMARSHTVPAVLLQPSGITKPSPRISRLVLSSSSSSDDIASNNKPVVSDIAKYVVATLVQYELLGAALKLLDRYSPIQPLPTPFVGLLFCFLSLRSRVASVLDNSRPNREAQDGKATPRNVKRPSWTPPGIAFPFIWLTITALRGISSALVYQQMAGTTATATLACPPLMAMILHLSIGDTWNTITNIEQRLGVSAVGVLVVWASVWNAIYQYHKVLPLAGRLLAPSGVWITIASVLTWTIWSLNDKPPLWPVAGNGKSASFKFSNLGQLQPTSIGGRSSDTNDDES